MTYTPVPVESFGGLDRRVDPTEGGLSRAVDGSNFDLDFNGRVRPRMGVSPVGGTSGTALHAVVYYKSAIGLEFAVTVADDDKVIPVAIGAHPDGDTLSVTTTGSKQSFVRFGAPGVTRLYAITNTNDIYYLEGTGWSSPTAAPAGFDPVVLGVTPNDNRLVLAGGSRVHFSNPGSDTFASDNFVDLNPGDGENIVALAVWREFTFVFKQTKFYVFTGTSVDASGGPIFNYRTVNTGKGVASLGAALAGDEGVYFCGPEGVWVTVGDAPVCVSDALGQQRGGDLLSVAQPDLAYWEQRLYIYTGNGGEVLVFDPKLNAWMQWDVGVRGLCALPLDGGLIASGGSTDVVQFSDDNVRDVYSALDPSGTAITWNYTSAMSDLGSPDRKVIREVSVWGQGAVTLKVAVDGGSLDTGSALSSTTFGEMVQRIARRGTYFAYQLSGTRGATDTKVNRLVFRLRDQEEPK